MDQNQQTPINVTGISDQPMPAANTSDQMPLHIDHKKVGPIITTLVVVLMLIIAALYIFASRLNQQAKPYDSLTAPNTSTSIQSAPTTVQPVTDTSTDVQSLQNDLNNSTSGLNNQNF